MGGVGSGLALGEGDGDAGGDGDADGEVADREGSMADPFEPLHAEAINANEASTAAQTLRPCRFRALGDGPSRSVRVRDPFTCPRVARSTQLLRVRPAPSLEHTWGHVPLAVRNVLDPD